MRTVVYVEPLEAGHAIDHLAFYLDVCAAADLRMAAFVTPRVWEGARRIIGADDVAGERVGDLERQDLSAAAVGRLLDDVDVYCRKTSPIFIYFPWLDLFVGAFFRRKLFGNRLPIPVAGVLFRDPFNYLDELGSRPVRWFRVRAKLAGLRWALRGTAREILTFNPAWRVRFPVPVTVLPDALSSLDRRIEQAGGAPWPAPFPDGRPAGRIGFLLFGHMAPRKGVLEAIEGFKRLPDQALAGARLRLLGEFPASPYRTAVHTGLQDLERRGLQVELFTERLCEAALDAAILDCDFILAPYIDHQGSSGSIGLAARYGRPVLTQHTNQVGAETRMFDLGVTVDPRDPDAVARGLRALLSGAIVPGEGMRRFVKDRSATRARAIAETVIRRVARAPDRSANAPGAADRRRT